MEGPTVTNNYYNCKFETHNTSGVPVLIDTSKQAGQPQVKQDANEQNELAYKATIKKIAEEVKQPESLIEYVIKLYVENDIR